MRIHLEAQTLAGDQGGWSAWVDIVHGDDRHECVWSRGGTSLRRLVQIGAEELIRRAETDEIELLRRRNAELEQLVAAWTARDRAAETDTLTRPVYRSDYHRDEHIFIDGLCACGAIEDRRHQAAVGTIELEAGRWDQGPPT